VGSRPVSLSQIKLFTHSKDTTVQLFSIFFFSFHSLPGALEGGDGRQLTTTLRPNRPQFLRSEAEAKIEGWACCWLLTDSPTRLFAPVFTVQLLQTFKSSKLIPATCGSRPVSLSQIELSNFPRGKTVHNLNFLLLLFSFSSGRSGGWGWPAIDNNV
jgi:hypothetical protein